MATKSDVKKAQLRVIEALAVFQLAEEELKRVTDAHPAKAECDKISAKIDALDWDAPSRADDSSRLLREMKEPSDRLYDDTRPAIDAKHNARRLLLTAERDLIAVCKLYMPKDLGHPLPAEIARMYDQAIEGTGQMYPTSKWYKQLVDVCLRLAV